MKATSTEIPGYIKRIMFVGWPDDQLPNVYPHESVAIEGSIDAILANELALLRAPMVVFYVSNTILCPSHTSDGARVDDPDRRSNLGWLLRTIILNNQPYTRSERCVVVFMPDEMDLSPNGVWDSLFGIASELPDDYSAPPPHPRAIDIDECSWEEPIEWSAENCDKHIVSQLYLHYANRQYNDLSSGNTVSGLSDRSMPVVCDWDGRIRGTLPKLHESVDMFHPLIVTPLDLGPGELHTEGACAVHIEATTPPGTDMPKEVEKEGESHVVHTFLLPDIRDTKGLIENAVAFLYKHEIRCIHPPAKLEDMLGLVNARHLVEAAMNGRNPIVGESAAILSIYPRLLRAIEDRKAPILIYGQIGSGKEVVFEALRLIQGSAKKQMVVDLSGLTPTSVTSELFGHVKGAYTGAIRKRKGAVETVEDGTVIIDNFQNATIDVQAKLLRLLEKKAEFQRLGSDTILKSAARIVIAMNIVPEQHVAAELMLPDLLSRLAIRINLPSLNERRSDIPLLIRHFIDECKGDHPGWPWKVMDINRLFSLQHEHRERDWNACGNVRGLGNEIRERLHQYYHNAVIAGLAVAEDAVQVAKGDGERKDPDRRRRSGRKEGPEIPDSAMVSTIRHAADNPGDFDIKWVFKQFEEDREKGLKRTMPQAQRAVIARIGRIKNREERAAALAGIRKVRGFKDLPLNGRK